jgi:hypothetical protein
MRGNGGKPEPVGQMLRVLPDADQDAKAGGVKERHLGQVDDHPGDGLAHRAIQGIARLGHGSHIELARQSHHNVTSWQHGRLRNHG